MINRTKIVATIGPSCKSPAVLEKLIDAGANVCRMNFSHSTHKEHAEVIETVRKINLKNNKHIALLADLQGPKLRIGKMENGGANLEKGQRISVTTLEVLGNDKVIYVNYPLLPSEVKPGENILLDDGKIHLRVLSTNGTDQLETEVVNGGFLSERKGFNLPNTKTTLPSMTEKDLLDLQFSLENQVDWIALSFVRTADDIRTLRSIIRSKGNKCGIIAKIEKPEAVENFDEILQTTDAIMVARGDLGVEMPVSQVPLIQKHIIEQCNIAGKPVIVATQMMESMIKNPSPTRAEVTDIANAVLDGADAVMLSAETSVGDFPIETVSMMSSIINEVEKEPDVYFQVGKPVPYSPTFLSDEICFTAVRISDHVKAKAIVGMTYSGYTAYKISSFRPRSPLYIFTSNLQLLNMMSLVWGVKAFYYDRYDSTDDTFNDQIQILKEMGLVNPGDVIIQTASMPIRDKSRTNAIKMDRVR